MISDYCGNIFDATSFHVATSKVMAMGYSINKRTGCFGLFAFDDAVGAVKSSKIVAK
jgi:hypothetical protein